MHSYSHIHTFSHNFGKKISFHRHFKDNSVLLTMFCLCLRLRIAVMFYYHQPHYESKPEHRPIRKGFMTDFHKLFMVRINKMIKKKTGGIHVIYDSLVYTDSLSLEPKSVVT